MLEDARGPADLTFDLGYELLDPTRRRFRLFRLRLGQQVRGVAVHEPGLEPAVPDQQEHDQPDEGEDVFAEQPIPTNVCAVLPASE